MDEEDDLGAICRGEKIGGETNVATCESKMDPRSAEMSNIGGGRGWPGFVGLILQLHKHDEARAHGVYPKRNGRLTSIYRQRARWAGFFVFRIFSTLIPP